MTRGGKMLSTRTCVSLKALTAGDGPLVFGVCSKSLTLAQLEAYLEASGPVSPSQQADMELASRGKLLRILGILQARGDGTTASLFLENRSLQGLKFSEESAGWNWFVYNIGVAMTTGASAVVLGSTFVEFNPSG